MGYSAKITAKGQITIPNEMRKALDLKPGDRIVFSQAPDGTFFVEHRAGSLAELRGIVKAKDIKGSDIETWIAEARGRASANPGKRSA